MIRLSHRHKVAVIMAAYNAEDTLREAFVDSVLSSTAQVDLFIADDGSRIPVYQLLKNTLGRIPESVKILRNGNSTGPGGSRNMALSKSFTRAISTQPCLTRNATSPTRSDLLNKCNSLTPTRFLRQ